MNKTFILLLMLYMIFPGISHKAYSQNGTLVTEGFEGSSSLPAGWTSEAITGNPWKIESNATYAHTGSRSATFASSTSSHNSWLFTPEMLLEEGKSYRLSFYMRTRNANEALKIHLGHSASASGMDTEYLLDFNPYKNETYEKIEVIFSAEASGNYFIGFNAYSGSGGWAIFIDDVLIEELGGTDIALSDIMPDNIYTGITDICVLIENAGGNIVTEMEIDYKVGDDENTYSWTGSLLPGKTETVLLASGYNFSTAGNVDIEITAKLEEDTNTENNTIAKTLGVYDRFKIPYIQNFDDTDVPALPVLWELDNSNGDNVEWMTQNNSLFIKSSPNSLMIGQHREKNDWAFTPEIYFKAGKKYILEFYAKSQYAGASYRSALKIHMGAHATVEEMQDEPIKDITSISETSFQAHSVVFEVEETGYYSLGLHCYGTSTATTSLYIDDLMINELPDAGISDITAPDSFISPGTYDLEVILKNYSENLELTSATVAYKIGENGIPVTYEWTGNLEPGEETTVVFDELDFTTAGEYIIIAYTNLPNGEEDGDTTNDSFRKTVTAFDAPTLPFSEGFEDSTSLPSMWITEDNSGDARTWEVKKDATYAHTGTNFVVMDGTSNVASNDWLFTPGIPLEKGKGYRLSFYMRTRFGKEDLNVHIGKAAVSTAMGDEPLLNINQYENQQYEEKEILLSVEEDGSYHIGFHAYGSPTGWQLILDDILLEELSGKDVAVTDILLNDNIYTGNYDIQAVLHNLGGVSISEMDITYKIDDTENTYKWTGNLISGTSEVITLVENYDFTTVGEYQVAVTAQLDGDTEPDNDEFSKIINVYQRRTVPYTENFDRVTIPALPPLWSIDDVNNDNNVWETIDYKANSEPNSLNVSGSAKDDWAFSPEISLQAGKKYNLSFFYRAGYESNPEKMDVYIIKETSKENTGTPLITLSRINNFDYQEAQKDFTVEEDGYYIIAFHANTQEYGQALYIDDISLTEIPDIGISDIISPIGTIAANTEYPVTVAIKNYSSTEVTSARVSYTINGGIPVEMEWKGSLPGNETINITFKDKILFEEGTNIVIEACTSLPNGEEDANPDNDCASSIINITEIFTYDIGIESITSPASTIEINTSYPLSVMLKNYSDIAITSARISYSIDGNTPVEMDWTGSLAGGAETEVVVEEEISFTKAGKILIEACAFLPNGEMDINEDNNCTSATIEVIDPSGIGTGITADILLYPNPFREELFINDTEQAIERIFITDMSGVKLMDIPVNGVQAIATSNLKEGIYFITLIDKSGNKTMRKMLKK